MRELTCIVCPMGCSLFIEEEGPPAGGLPAEDGLPALTVRGNRCPRGAVYAREEIRSPRLVVTATCGIAFGASALSRPLTAPRRVPVKTSVPCPRERIGELLADIYRLKAQLPIHAGDTLIPRWKGSDIDVIAVRSIE